MTARRSPDGQIYTEVPVIPTHSQLDGRSVANQHPISAITGLQEALDAKADAVDGGNLVTDEEKAKIEEMESGAQANVIETVMVNGVALTPEAKAVDVEVPTDYGKSLAYASNTGVLSLKDPSSAVLSTVSIPRKGVASASYSGSTEKLTLTLQDGSTVQADLSAIDTAYTAGDGLALANGAFSLSTATQTAIAANTTHRATDSIHVSQADRTKWNGVDSAVKTSGDQTVAGAKTFTGTVTVPTPTVNGHAATKAYVDAAVASGGGGGGGTSYTAGTGLTLEGTEFSLSSATQATLSGAVQKTGAETIAGVKTFSSSPVVPAPTSDSQAATKKYVDDHAGGSYTAGTGLTLSGTEFSLSSDTQTTLAAVSGKAADNAVVHTSGAETIAGVKTFSSIPVIPTDTPTSNGQVASKAYVDAAVAAGGGGGGGTSYTAGTGLQLVGTEFSLDSTTQTAVSAVSGKAADSAVVHNSGAETIAGVKTFSSSPIVPTPTTDYEVATKAYVDAAVASGGGGGGGTWTVLQPEDYASTTFSTLFSGSGTPYVALKDVHIVVFWGDTLLYTHTFIKGEYVNGNLSGTWATGAGNTSTNFAKMYRLLLKELIYSGSSSSSVGVVYSFTGVSTSTTTAATVKGVAETNSYANVIHQSTPAAAGSGKVGVFVQYR